MFRIVIASFFLATSVAYATINPMDSDAASDRVATSFSTRLFVADENGFRVCLDKPGAKTLVSQGLCLWESEIPASDLQHPGAVAGLMVEKAASISVKEFVQKVTGADDITIAGTRIEGDLLVVDTQATDRIFLSQGGF